MFYVTNSSAKNFLTNLRLWLLFTERENQFLSEIMAYFTKREDDALKAIKQNMELRLHKDDPTQYVAPDAVELTVLEENKLFDEIIHPAFKKLVDNLIFKYNLVNDENVKDLRTDLISHLIHRIEMYDYVKAKAFSYYNVLSRNYILGYLQKKKKRSSITSLNHHDANENPQGSDETSIRKSRMVNEFVDESYRTFAEPDENPTLQFYKFLKKKIARLIVKSDDPLEREFLKCTLQILETTQDSEEDSIISNRNLFYSSIRALSTLRQRDISRYFGRLRSSFASIQKEYLIHS